MTEKEYYIYIKNTVWERFEIRVEKKTEKEIDDYINETSIEDILNDAYNQPYYINSEILEDSTEEIPLEENQYNCTRELNEVTDKGFITIKTNLDDIEPIQVKMFSIEELENLWWNSYAESLKKDYNGFYTNLLSLVILNK